jgi:hypothetical protein
MVDRSVGNKLSTTVDRSVGNDNNNNNTATTMAVNDSGVLLLAQSISRSS